VVVSDVFDVSEVNATSILRAEICRLVIYCVYIAFCFEGDEVGVDASSKPVEQRNRKVS
jgi:hypothetical protein